MSLLFIDTSDFIGEINLDLKSDTDVSASFESLGRQIEDDILLDLLNAPLLNDLMADLDVNGDPQTQIYIDLVDGVTYANPSGVTVNYAGLKRMLRYFVWSDYLEINRSQNVSTGQMVSLNENSEPLTRGQLIKVRKPIQNKAVRLYNQAAIFINDNYTDYFSNNDYGFWRPKSKKYLGTITTQTYSNSYFYNRSSEGN